MSPNNYRALVGITGASGILIMTFFDTPIEFIGAALVGFCIIGCIEGIRQSVKKQP